MTSYSGIGCLI